MTDYSTIHQVIVTHTAETPDRVAILGVDGSSLTYHMLAERIATIECTLRDHAIVRGDRVALVGPNGPELAATLLALAALTTVTPLARATMEADYQRAFERVRPRALVVLPGHRSHAITAAQVMHVPVISLQSADYAEGRRGTWPTPAPTDIALLMPTSGTTGEPKLVPLTHGNIMAAADFARRAFHLTPSDRCFYALSLVHISGFMTVLSALFAGGSVIVAPEFVAPRFAEWLDEFRPTWIDFAPAIHQAIVEQAAAHPDLIARCPLRFVRSGGASLPTMALAALEDALATPVIEAYGMTEALYLTANRLPPEPRKVGSVGRSLGAELAVVDPLGNWCEPKIVGEIVVRGPNVMAAYDGEQANGASVYLPGGWFRTGDLGYLDREGFLFLTGRRKELINRGGEKVAPAEVEAVLLMHPAVAAAVAFAMPDPRLGEEVAAAVVPRQNCAVAERELRAFAAGRLGPGKTPRRIVSVEAMPTGPNGKIRRGELAARLGLVTADGRRLPAPARIAPRSPEERLVAEIWTEVLGVQVISVDDDFLDLGGDSVLAARVLARLQAIIGEEFPVAELFAAATVADQVKLLTGHSIGSTTPIGAIR